MTTMNKTRGWGIVEEGGTEIWDAEPVFKNASITLKDKLLLLFYPKKWFLYRYIHKNMNALQHESSAYRILDVGCGTGATVIDLKKMFGDAARVEGVDVVKIQVDLAQEKLERHNIHARIQWYDGMHLPFENKSIDAIYTSDVLGHVENVDEWLKELHRVLVPGGTLAMFSESKLGRHAFIRNYLFKHGLNVDPHAKFHISLYSKKELKELLLQNGFEVEKMYGSFWAKFFVHPDELFPALQSQNKFPVLKKINSWLTSLKKKTSPYSLAVAEFYGLVEMILIGQWLETQGYIILAKKK